MRRRLRPPQATAEADVRPTLLGVVTLLFLLLFFLLGTTSGQKLAVVGLRVGTAEGMAPLPHAGLLRSARIEVAGVDVTVRAEVQTTDIAASATSTELRVVPIPGVSGPGGRSLDRVSLERTLAELHAIDGSQRRATVLAADEVNTADLLAVLDAVRGPANSRFPEVVLQDLVP